MKTLMEKKHVLLKDEASDWLRILTAASSLNVKGNQAIKENFVFLANWSVIPNTVTNIKMKTCLWLITFFLLHEREFAS